MRLVWHSCELFFSKPPENGMDGRSTHMHTTRPTIYETLRRWAEEGVAGLDAKPKTNKGVRTVTLYVRNEIRKLQENPRLGRVSGPYRALA